MVCHFDDTLAEMSGQPQMMHTYILMVSKKDKRHSGWITPTIQSPTMKYSDIIIEALEPMNFFDEWEYWKDSMRDVSYLEWKRRDKAKTHKVTKANSVVTI